jgi:GTPase SAR1 family protein
LSKNLKKRTILIYGRTNAGKTALIGELAEHVFKTTGKRTRLYTADKGGTDTIKPYIDLSIIHAEELGDSDPWIFLDKATKGYVRNEQGKWVLDAAKNAQVGLFAFESLRAFAENLMVSMAQKSAQGVNIGGGANINFQIAADGEQMKVSGSNMAHFGVAQSQVTEKVWQSQKLDAPYIVWTSSVSKDEDTTAAGKILGPDVIGKALTPEVPRWFNLTFRVDVLPASQGKPERHILYMGNHVDSGAGNAAGLGNVRLPLDATLEKNTVEPASIVEALRIIEGGYDKAVDAIKKRLSLK